MAKEITLEALAKGKEEAPRQELQKIDAESIKAQVEDAFAGAEGEGRGNKGRNRI